MVGGGARAALPRARCVRARAGPLWHLAPARPTRHRPRRSCRRGPQSFEANAQAAGGCSAISLPACAALCWLRQHASWRRLALRAGAMARRYAPGACASLTRPRLRAGRTALRAEALRACAAAQPRASPGLALRARRRGCGARPGRMRQSFRARRRRYALAAEGGRSLHSDVCRLPSKCRPSNRRMPVKRRPSSSNFESAVSGCP